MGATTETSVSVYTSPVIAREHRGFLVEDSIGWVRMVSEKPRLQLNHAMNSHLMTIINYAAAFAGLGIPRFAGVDETDHEWRLYEAVSLTSDEPPTEQQVRLARLGIQRMLAPPFSDLHKKVFREMATESGFRYPLDAVAFGPVLDQTLPSGPDSPIYVVDSPPHHGRPTGLLDWYAIR